MTLPKVIRGGGAAMLAVVVLPAIAAAPVRAATSPDPAAMRAAIADPVEPGFLEVLDGSASLEGPFSASTYADFAASDPKSRSSILKALQQYGFVGGFGRDWWMSRTSEQLEELLMVFADERGAAQTASSSRGSYHDDSRYRSSFDPDVNDGAYGINEEDAGYFWSVVIFTKGNEMFAVERGSAIGYPTALSIAQAKKAFASAPDSIAVPPAKQPTAPASSRPDLRPFFIAAFAMMLLAAAAIGVVLFVAFSPRSRPTAAMEGESKP